MEAAKTSFVFQRKSFSLANRRAFLRRYDASIVNERDDVRKRVTSWINPHPLASVDDSTNVLQANVGTMGKDANVVPQSTTRTS